MDVKEEYERGNELVRKGWYELAVARYLKALEILSPNLAPCTITSKTPPADLLQFQLKLFLNLSHCHLKLRNYEIARDYCNECLALDPKNLKAYLRRALANEGMGNFHQSLSDLMTALQLNPNSALLSDILHIQTRVRSAVSLDEKALREEIVPISYVTSNQSLRLNFGGVYPAEITLNEPFRIRLNITNEFGLWNRLHLAPSSDLDDHLTNFPVDVSLVQMIETDHHLSLEVSSNQYFGANGRVEVTISITMPISDSTNHQSIPFLLKFFCPFTLPSGLSVHPILTLPILLRNSTLSQQPSFLSTLCEMTTQLNANGIRIQSIKCGDASHEVYVLESPGALGIGGKVWDATYVILDYLQTVPEYVNQRHIIELGSGTGLVGLSLRYFSPSSVVLTDIPAVVPLLKANIFLNQLLSHTSTNSALPPPIYDAVTHVWGTPLDPLITTPPTAPSQPSLVVASDVVYDPAGFQPLLTTLQSLLIPSLSTGQGREPYADLVIMAHRHRNPEDHHFFTMVSSEESGLRIQEINLDHIFAKYHQGDNSLRDVQIYHITKQ